MAEFEMAADAVVDLADDLNTLWCDEGCDWTVEHVGGDWRLVLDFTSNDIPYDGADDRYVTTSWLFYGVDVNDALAKAIAWCWLLTDEYERRVTTDEGGQG